MAVWQAPGRKSICIIRYGTHRKISGLPCYFFLSKFSLSLQNLVLYLITSSNRNNVFSCAWSLNKTLESKQLWSGKLRFICLSNPEPACLEQDEHRHIQMDNKTQLHLAWHGRAATLNPRNNPSNQVKRQVFTVWKEEMFKLALLNPIMSGELK